MIYVGLFGFSLFLTFSIKYIALKKSLLVEVNERSLHTTPTPHGGGVAIGVAWFLGLVYLFTCNAIDDSLCYALLCGSLLSIVSFLDDVYELSTNLRLFVQSLVGIMGLYVLGGLTKIDFGFWILENQFIANALAFFAIMWFINLYNFLDGIDGYAGSEAVFLGSAGWFFFGGEHFLVLVASVLGFLVLNWHKAKIFMGDVGSTLLGYNIAIFAIYYQNQGVSLWVWLILFGVFWFDATLTLWRRYKKGEKLYTAHKKHAYQRLTQSGWSHSQVVIAAMFLNVVLVILGYISLHFKALSFICFIGALALLHRAMKYVDNRKKFE